MNTPLNKKLNILIWHGYLLSGTGSNIYAQNIAKQFIKQGHNVFLFCQDRDIESLDFIASLSIVDNSQIRTVKEMNLASAGNYCKAYNPDIGKILPVYVLDAYKHFTSKLFLDLTEKELSYYIDSNAAALETFIKNQRIDIIHVNHAVMGPIIAAQIKKKFDIPFVVTIHGSDLEFTVKHSNKYKQFAYEGLTASSSIILPSVHIKNILLEIFPEDKIAEKTAIIPAGADTDLFKPRHTRKRAIINIVNIFQENLAYGTGFSPDILTEVIDVVPNNQDPEKLASAFHDIHNKYNDRLPDKNVIEKILSIKEKDRVVIFTGKLIATKGIHLICFSMLFILSKFPDVKFLICGFGPLREPIEALLGSLKTGNVEQLEVLTKTIELMSKSLGDIPVGPVDCLNQIKHNNLLEKMFDIGASIDIENRFIFTGPLSHDELAPVLSLADISLIISVFPEAFGMVAAEAASCGVLPIVANHSGLAEIGSAIEDLTKVPYGLLKIDMGSNSVSQLIDHVSDSLNFINTYPQIRDELRIMSIEKYSWLHISNELLNLYNELAYA